MKIKKVTSCEGCLADGGIKICFLKFKKNAMINMPNSKKCYKPKSHSSYQDVFLENWNSDLIDKDLDLKNTRMNAKSLLNTMDEESELSGTLKSFLNQVNTNTKGLSDKQFDIVLVNFKRVFVPSGNI